MVEVKDGVYVEIADGVVKETDGKYTGATPEADDYILTVEGETVTVELYEAPAAGGSGTTDTNTGDNTGEGEEGTGN